ncbi:hypothetical protein ACHHYP_12497 [Achlya hypogyna]|uniref:CST complex subunit CTC1 n=1 Tax=Achlya hypogyna TaxID=1202772 RepID=A0A1V9YGV0_ACHHY|nr:hypothetical protein ACHHYP_12497 [Achlya hypogyna]
MANARRRGDDVLELGDLGRYAARQLRTASLQRFESISCCRAVPTMSCTCAFANDAPHVIVTPITRVMLYGVLDVRRHRLLLRDGSTNLRVSILAPTPNAFGQILCVSSWTYVQTPLAGYLEVTAFDVAAATSALAPWQQPQFDWPSFLSAHYPRQDAPTYGGANPISSAVSAATASKKVRWYLALGRLEVLSPVTCDYFFMELAVAHDGNRQSVQVLVADGTCAGAHPCLEVGMNILVTDAIKIYAKESGVYMLQTTATSVVRLLPPPWRTSLPPIPVTESGAIQSTRWLRRYRGVLTRWICRDTYELDGAITLQCVHFPAKVEFRVGMTIDLANVHVTAKSTLGLCAHSSVAVRRFASVPTRLLVVQKHTGTKTELALHRLPLAAVAALSTLLQELLHKFSSTTALTTPSPPWQLLAQTKDPHRLWRKRVLLQRVAAMNGVQWQATLPALAMSFLEHDTCFSGRDVSPLGSAIPLRTLFEAAVSGGGLEADDDALRSVLLLGCLSGSMATSNVEFQDRTARVPLVIQAVPGVCCTATGATLVQIRRCRVVVNRLGIGRPGAPVPGLCHIGEVLYGVHIECSAEDMAPIVPDDDVLAAALLPPPYLLVLVLHVERAADGYLVHGIHVPEESRAVECVDIFLPSLPWHVARGVVWQIDLFTLTKVQDVTFAPPDAARGAFDAMQLIGKLGDYFAATPELPTAVSPAVADLTSRPLAPLRLVTFQASPFTHVQAVHVQPDSAVEAVAKCANGLRAYNDDRRADAPCVFAATLALSVRRWQELSLVWALVAGTEPFQALAELCVVPLTPPLHTTCVLAEYKAPPHAHADRIISLLACVESVAITWHHDVLRNVDDPVVRVVLRGADSLDTADISWSLRRFGWLSGLAPGALLALHRVKLHIRRVSFKPYLGVCHTTQMTVLPSPSAPLPVAPRRSLLALYQYECIDRRVYEHVVSVCHVAYAIVKLQCAGCYRPVARELQGMLRHAAPDLTSCPAVRSVVVGCSVKCIVDDGSAQVDLFAHGEAAWQLLHVPRAVRARFEAAVTTLGSEIAYFATQLQAANDVPAPVQLQVAAWRSCVLDALQSQSECVVRAKRFYSQPKAATELSVLRCGEFQLRTPVQPMVHIEVVDVAELPTKAEWRRLVLQLQASRDATCGRKQ